MIKIFMLIIFFLMLILVISYFVSKKRPVKMSKKMTVWTGVAGIVQLLWFGFIVSGLFFNQTYMKYDNLINIIQNALLYLYLGVAFIGICLMIYEWIEKRKNRRHEKYE